MSGIRASASGTGRPICRKAYCTERMMPMWEAVTVPSRSKKTYCHKDSGPEVARLRTMFS